MPTRSKYRNQPTWRAGRYFQSLHEADCGQQLMALEKAGKISNLEFQKRISILPTCKMFGYRNPLVYVADFYYHQDGRRIVADAKGLRTPVYRIKKRLLAQLCNIRIEEM